MQLLKKAFSKKDHLYCKVGKQGAKLDIRYLVCEPNLVVKSDYTHKIILCLFRGDRIIILNFQKLLLF